MTKSKQKNKKHFCKCIKHFKLKYHIIISIQPLQTLQTQYFVEAPLGVVLGYDTTSLAHL